MSALPSLSPTPAELADAEQRAAQIASTSPTMAAARVHLERAYVELAAAVQEWGSWADTVAQGEEKNVGLGIEAGGLIEGQSPLYDAALSLGAPYLEARGAVADQLCELWTPYAERRAAGHLLAAVSAHLAEGSGKIRGRSS